MYITTSVRKLVELPHFSAFPMAQRPFTEPISAEQDTVIPKGTTLPSLIKLYYGAFAIKAIDARWGFLSRDNKRREYKPDVEDPFVFKDQSSIAQFRDSAARLLQILGELAHGIGAPVKNDVERRVIIIDSDKLHASATHIDAKENPTDKTQAYIAALQYLVGNTDIMKKACIVRGITPGWWAVSYKGKNSGDITHFSRALVCFQTALRHLRKLPVFKARYTHYWEHNSDPIDTNPGYPYFSVQVTGDGTPVIRDLTVKQFKSVLTLARSYHPTGKLTWANVLKAADSLNIDENLAGHPFAIAPLRRLSPGYKWSHVCDTTAAGMRTNFDVRGINTQRVAWMVPYIYNAIISPGSVLLKTVRSFLPGCTHTASDKTFQSALLGGSAHTSIRLYEADYSNYDRFIPVDLIRIIINTIAEELIPAHEREYWNDALMHLHDGASLIWPDYSNVETGRGWIFKPGRLGLMSGVKVTSETGTLVNFIVNIANCFEAGIFKSNEDAVKYMTAIAHAQSLTDLECNNYTRLKDYKLRFLVQSDDTLLIGYNSTEGENLRDAFVTGLKKAGLKGAVEEGDRFLMRHTSLGGDRPVAARVWQNTLSGETPPETELIFLLGLLARTDGLFGIKQVDPFNTRNKQRLTNVEIIFSFAVIVELRKFITTAALPSHKADLLLSAYEKEFAALVKALKQETERTGRIVPRFVPIPSSVTKLLTTVRKELTDYVIELERQLAASKKTANVWNLSDKYNQWIMNLAKDKHVPSAALVTEYLMATDSTVRTRLEQIAGKEESYFDNTAHELGLTAIQLLT